MKIIKKYKWSILLLLIIFLLFFYNHKMGIDALKISITNLKEMFFLLPPIFIIMGLLEVWAPKEILMKYMGSSSGLTGFFIAFLLGTVAAGPLYIAFPMGILLLKKGARLANIIFFLGVWATTKLPLLLFEIASFGTTFTLIHISVSLPLYLLIAYIIEKSVSSEELSLIINREDNMQ